MLSTAVCVAAGPALCVAVRGISGLPADKLAQLLSLFSGSAGTPANRSSGGVAAGSAAAGQSGASVVQMGLASAWAVTDVLQVCPVSSVYRAFHTRGLTVHVNHVAACCIRRCCSFFSLRSR
jgi:hypothetical protein